MSPLTRSVCLAEIVATVGDGERAIRRDRCLDPISLAIRRVFQIGDLIRRRIVRRVAIEQRQVALPDVLDCRKPRHPQIRILLVRFRAARRGGLHRVVHLSHAFTWTVVNYDHPRMDRAQKRRRARSVQTAQST